MISVLITLELKINAHLVLVPISSGLSDFEVEMWLMGSMY